MSHRGILFVLTYCSVLQVAHGNEQALLSFLVWQLEISWCVVCVTICVCVCGCVCVCVCCVCVCVCVCVSAYMCACMRVCLWARASPKLICHLLKLCDLRWSEGKRKVSVKMGHLLALLALHRISAGLRQAMEICYKVIDIWHEHCWKEKLRDFYVCQSQENSFNMLVKDWDNSRSDGWDNNEWRGRG